jgi:hypothetical protein
MQNLHDEARRVQAKLSSATVYAEAEEWLSGASALYGQFKG